ncbi:hypothetical protein WME94_34540 [Sorangium sp. So ce429]
MLDFEMPVPPKVTEHPPNGVLYDLTDLASWKMTELVPHELGAVFVISPVEEDHVQMRIEPRVAGRALHDGHRAALDRAARASARGAFFVEPLHALDEEAGQHAEQRPVLGEPAPPRKRKRQHPRTVRHLGQDVLDQVRRRGTHASAQTRRAETASFTAEGHQPTLFAALAPEAREPAAEQPAVEVGFELLLRVLGYPDGDGAVVDGPVQRLHVVAHELVERRLLGTTALVDDARGASRAGHTAPTPHAARHAVRARFRREFRQTAGLSPMAAPWRSGGPGPAGRDARCRGGGGARRAPASRSICRRARTRERERAALQEEIIRVQQSRLAELSTPMIPITKQVMVMPLIGTMDEPCQARA